MSDKRIKVICPDGKWWQGQVFIDGKPLDCTGVQINITGDAPYPGTVTLTFDALDVDLDFKAQTDTDVVTAIRNVERRTGKQLLISD